MKTKIISIALTAILLTSTALTAQWQKVTDFEGMVAEDLNRYFQYPGFGTFYLMPGLDPTDPENSTLYMDAEERGVRCNRLHVAVPLPEPVAVGSVATLRFDFYQYGTSYDLNIGLSPTPITIDPETGLMMTPESFADFEAQIRMNTPVDVRDGNDFRPTELIMPVNEWITYYVVIDHRNQTVEGYMRRGDDTLEKVIIPMPDGQPSKDSWLFRVGRQEPLVSFYVGSSNSCERGYDLGDIWLIDNIYISSGKNLDDGSVPAEKAIDVLIAASNAEGDGVYSHPLFGSFTVNASLEMIYSFKATSWMAIARELDGSYTAHHLGLDKWIYLPVGAPGFANVYGEGWARWEGVNVTPMVAQ